MYKFLKQEYQYTAKVMVHKEILMHRA